MEVEDEPEVKESELPIIPNYLSNPPFLFGKMNKNDLNVAQHIAHNGTGERLDAVQSEPATLSPSQEQQPRQRLYSDSPNQPSLAFVPVMESNSHLHNQVVNGTLSMDLSSEAHHNEYNHNHSIAQNGSVCSSIPSPGPGSNPTITRQPSLPQQINCSQPGGSMPAFQPFFFTSTFPVNVHGMSIVGPFNTLFTYRTICVVYVNHRHVDSKTQNPYIGHIVPLSGFDILFYTAPFILHVCVRRRKYVRA